MLMVVPWGLLVQSWKIPLPHPRQTGIQQGTCSKPARIRTTPDPAISVILSLKLCSTLSEEKKKCDYNVQAFRSPPSMNTYFSPTFGGTWSLHSGPTSMWKLPASKIPGGGRAEKNKLTCTAKEAFTEQSIRENAFPFTELARGETPNGGASTGTLESGGSNPRKEEKRGKTHTLGSVLVKSQTMGTNSQRQH